MEKTGAKGAKKIDNGRHAASRALLVLSLFMACALALSCSGRLEASIRGDFSTRMSLRMDIPEALGARVRQFAQIPAKANIFDIARIRDEFAGRKAIFLVDASTPTADSLTSIIWIPDMTALIADTASVPAGMVEYRKLPAAGGQPVQREFAVNLSRNNAGAAFSLFPGVDRKLVDSLSPPALETDPITAAEYRMNLETVIIGKKAMPSFDACGIDISITAPKTILSCEGGSSSGQVFRSRISLFDLLVLEKPIRLALRWAD